MPFPHGSLTFPPLSIAPSMRLRQVSVALSFLLLLLLAYTAWWASAAWQLRAGIERWVAAQRAGGATVIHEDLTIDGFPLELAVSTGTASLRLPDGTESSAARLSVAADVWDPLSIRLTALESPRVVLPSGDGAPLVIAAEAGSGTATLTTTGRVRQALISLTDMVLTAPGAEPVLAARAEVTTALPDQPPATHTDPAGSLGLVLTDVTLPPAADPSDGALGPTVAQAAVTATILGDLPPRPGPGDLRAWRDSGGTVEVTGLTLDWGGVSLRGDATLSLDGEMQPLGAGALTVGGMELLLDALAAQGAISANEARQARPLVTLMAQPQEDGVRRITLPLTLQDRRLSLGPIVLATLPPLAWPE